jgi:hypothetical protein
MKKLTLPSWYYPAIVCMDYSGLDNTDRKTLNTSLLDNGVLFSDCIKTSEEYTKLTSGVFAMVQDFYFKGA